jgi:hypothetical protein
MGLTFVTRVSEKRACAGRALPEQTSAAPICEAQA